ILPLPSAMVLHAITQMASNGWRAFLWRSHIRWRPVAIYLIGCALALGAWSITRYVPDKALALLLLGVTPFMARLTPRGLKPDPGVAAVAVAASMLGTTLARRILEAMTDLQFRTWAGRLITTVAGYYIIYGSWLLLARSSAASF